MQRSEIRGSSTGPTWREAPRLRGKGVCYFCRAKSNQKRLAPPSRSRRSRDCPVVDLSLRSSPFGRPTPSKPAVPVCLTSRRAHESLRSDTSFLRRAAALLGGLKSRGAMNWLRAKGHPVRVRTLTGCSPERGPAVGVPFLLLRFTRATRSPSGPAFGCSRLRLSLWACKENEERQFAISGYDNVEGRNPYCL